MTAPTFTEEDGGLRTTPRVLLLGDLIPSFRPSEPVGGPSHARWPRDLKLTPLTLSLFNKQRSRGTVCGGSLPDMTVSPCRKQEDQYHFVSQKLDFLSPFLFYFFARLLLIRRRTHTETLTLSTGHCIVIRHIRLLMKQHFYIFSVPRCFILRSKDKHELITLPIFNPFSVVFLFFFFNLDSFIFNLLSKEVLAVPFNTLLRKRPNETK